MDTRMAQTIRRLSVNSNQRLRLSVLSKEVNLSDRRLEQLFKAQTGMTLVAFYRDCRMRSARKLLTANFHSIKEIASELGYEAVAVFCRDFKRTTGCTATEFRLHFGKSQ